MSNRQDDALPVVAWMESWPQDRIRHAGCRVDTVPFSPVDWNDYDELVRLSDAQSAIASLQARLDAAEKDAARWRWLRDQHTYDGSGDRGDISRWFVHAGREPVPCDPGALDSETDAARSAT